MTIRTRLLILLLPTLTAFAILISLFFFFNWDREITDSFKDNLKSIVVTIAKLIDPKEIEWLLKNSTHDIQKTETYKKNTQILNDLKDNLPVAGLYIIEVEPVKIGEPVMLNHPVDESNPIYNGTNREFAYRQKYLIDTENHHIQDFSENNEFLIYSNKKPLLTPIYRSLRSKQPYMTGFAPILNEDHKVIALVGADVNMELLQNSVKREILVIALSALTALFFITLSVIFIANKIANPVNQLKNAVLGIAAGDYEEKMDVKGPKEIAELSNSFNTMRECLLDQMKQLKEQSFLREKFFGEHECSFLLQHRMIDGSIDRFEDDRLEIKHLTSSLTGTVQGLKLDLSSTKEAVMLSFTESAEDGFEGVYDLLRDSSTQKEVLLLTVKFPENSVHINAKSMPFPLLWSQQQGRFVPDHDPLHFENGDILIFFNKELTLVFPNRQVVKDWMGKVLRQFAKENQELLGAMLTSELNYWMKKLNSSTHIHIFMCKFNLTIPKS